MTHYSMLNSEQFSFILPRFGRIPFWNSEKSKGGPFGEKNMKKIDFYVWYLKRTAVNVAMYLYSEEIVDNTVAGDEYYV